MHVMPLQPSEEAMIRDSAHWQNVRFPYSPNPEEVKLYSKFIGDRQPVYMLGMTKALVCLTDVAVDLNPIDIGKPCLKADWRDLEGFEAGVMIGDGVLNLLGLGFVDKALSISKRLVCRVFLKKLPEMKYATFFPTEFTGHTELVNTQEGIAIVVWDRS